jgi:phosphatidylglycerol---prolipoprotein diacylglyceryl transferase
MRRILFRWRGLTVWSYPAMLYLGLVAGLLVENLAAHATGVDPFRVFVATLLLLIPAIAGARLLYAAAHFHQYRESPRRIWNRDEGGMAMYGALPLMLPISVPVVAAFGIGFGAFWDVASLTILTGLAVTKIGCLLNGCCAGRPSRACIAVSLPDIRGVSEKRIPVQCLESAWAIVVLGAACVLLGRLPFPGALFLIVATIYATGRLAFECLRQRELEAGRIRIGYAASLLMVISAVTTLIVRWPG